MEEAFIEHLDQIYWQGYGETFKEDNPEAYYRQLEAFTEIYSPKKKIRL